MNPILQDAAGLAHPAIQPKPKHKRPSRGIVKTTDSTSGRLASEMLRRRFDVLRLGGTVEQAAAISAAELGVTVDEAMELYGKPGYEPLPVLLGRKYTAKDNRSVGVIGLRSGTRIRQLCFTWWGNFAHSLQGFWDVKRGPAVAFLGVLHFPELRVFLDHFKSEFGSNWREALWQDIERCHSKFGERKGVRPVSESCLEKVRAALAVGAASAAELSRRTKFSLRQMKRAVAELKRRQQITATGRTKAKKWNLNSPNNSGHTDDMKEGGRGINVSLSSLTPEHRIGRNPPLLRRKQRYSKGCPQNQSGRTREQYLADKAALSEAKKAAKLATKDAATRAEIVAIGLTGDCARWWLGHPAEYRLLKGYSGHVWSRYIAAGRQGEPPPPLLDWLRTDWRGDGRCGVLGRLRRNHQRRAEERARSRGVRQGEAQARAEVMAQISS